jgi:hypothetical protein
MIYELRVYRCMPGRKGEVLAFWDTLVGDQDELVYITRYESWEDREKKWGAFQADPEWQRVRDRSQERGWLVEHIRTALLTATDFSPRV